MGMSEENIDYRDFYSRFIDITNMPDDGELPIKCPFHNDSNPSMYINLYTGRWKCQACDAGVNGGGHIADWMSEWFDIPLKDALSIKTKYENTGQLGIPIDKTIVNDLHQELLNSEEALATFTDKRGINLESISEFQIGYESANNRYTFPVYSARGDVINIRRYKMGAKKAKFINMKGAYTKSMIWPLDNTFWNSGWVVIFEGEPDTVLARQHNIPAVTQTGGAGQWPKEVGHWFTNKIVFICYDSDNAGRDGADRVGNALKEYAKDIYVTSIPKEGWDFTDYIMKGGKEYSDFQREVLKKGKKFVPAVEHKLEEQEQENLDDLEFTETTLTEATNDPGYNNTGVRIEARVQGREAQPYSSPKQVNVSCKSYDPENKQCQGCILASLTQEQIKEGYDFNFGRTRDVLTYIGANDEQRENRIKQTIGVPAKCPKPKIEEKEIYNVETLYISPDISKFSNEIKEDELDAQTAYYVYPRKGMSAKSNRSYIFNALRTTSPNDGTAAYLILEATAVQESFDKFNPTKEELERLKVFQPAEGQSVKDKMYEIAADLELWTQIWGRRDLIIAYDLAYHSVLRFHFNRKLLHRGWIDMLVIGDPRTGKSETAEYLARYYQQGDMFEGEGTRVTGLTGTVETKNGGQWMITWGKFPMNDRKLLIIDEASGLDKDMFGELSGMRSRGVVEINKAKQGQAYARTRAIWMSNPRGGKMLKDFDYGVRSVKDLVNQAEDIARFDFAMGVSKDEVPEEVINQVLDDKPREPQTYTSELCQQLILWTWSRNARGRLSQDNDKVYFEPEAVKTILRQASILGDRYECSIPIFEQNSLRIKLARMSVACAARLFSTDEEMEKVIVKPEHVEFIAEFVDELFKKPAFDYWGLAQEEQSRHRVTDKQKEEIMLWFVTHQKESKYIDGRKAKNWTSKNLEEGLGMDTEEARDIISALVDMDLIYDGTAGNSYRTTHKWHEQYQQFKKMTEKERQNILNKG